MKKRLNILVIAHLVPGTAQTVVDHVNAFKLFSKHRVFIYNHYNALEESFRNLPENLDLARFDVVVIHYSTYLLNKENDYLSLTAKKALRDYCGLKAIFRQDEYEHVDGLIHILTNLRIDVLFTTFSEKDANHIYARPGLERLRKVNTLTGYVPDLLLRLPVLPIKERKVDVGYRGRKLPFCLGSLGLEKSQLAEKFSAIAPAYDLQCNISAQEEDRLYGQAWIDFIGSCRVMLGTESGSSVVDFTGEIRERSERYVAQHPNATFEEVRSLFFADKDWEYNQAQISPRIFEAAALRTPLVLYEGAYSGFLEPWRHYVPLRKDFSNIDNVVSVIKNVDHLQKLADTTYQEVARNPRCSYKYFIKGFDEVVTEECDARETECASNGYSNSEFLRTVEQLPDYGPSPAILMNVQLSSTLSFIEGHGLEINMGKWPRRGYIAANDGQEFPQEIVMKPLRGSILTSIRIMWLSNVECGRDFSVSFFLRNALVTRKYFRDNNSAYNVVSIPPTAADCIKLVVHTFNGQQRLLMRGIQFRGWVPIAWRIRNHLSELFNRWHKKTDPLH